MGKSAEIKIDPAEPFKWPKGLCLSATSNVVVLLPGQLIQNAETIGSIIEVPDDANIGFRNGMRIDEPFDCLMVRLKPGMSLKLNRSTEVIIMHNSTEPVVFKIEKSDCS